MLVVGLHGWILPPEAILVCDLFVYSEFMINPVLLLMSSTRMRMEIRKYSLRDFVVSKMPKSSTACIVFTS